MEIGSRDLFEVAIVERLEGLRNLMKYLNQDNRKLVQEKKPQPSKYEIRGWMTLQIGCV
jgi:hypothetical protein